jgi:hypothetical protein
VIQMILSCEREVTGEEKEVREMQLEMVNFRSKFWVWTGNDSGLDNPISMS